MCACVCREREAEEGRLEPRLRSVQLTGNTTALNGSASHLKRDGTICVAQDLFPGDNGFFNFTNTVHGEGKQMWETCLPSQSLHACSSVAALPQTSREDCFGVETLITSVCVLFVLVYSQPVIKASAWGRRKGMDSLYQVAVAIWTSHFLCRPVHLAWLKQSSALP